MFYIGVDIGTTSTKAVLFSEDSSVVKTHHVEYPLYSPTPLTAEQNPDDIFQAVLKSISGVMEESKIEPGQVSLVSFSSAMHSVIAVDQEGHPLTQCITWADSRSKKWSD